MIYLLLFICSITQAMEFSPSLKRNSTQLTEAVYYDSQHKSFIDSSSKKQKYAKKNYSQLEIKQKISQDDPKWIFYQGLLNIVGKDEDEISEDYTIFSENDEIMKKWIEYVFFDSSHYSINTMQGNRYACSPLILKWRGIDSCRANMHNLVDQEYLLRCDGCSQHAAIKTFNNTESFFNHFSRSKKGKIEGHWLCHVCHHVIDGGRLEHHIETVFQKVSLRADKSIVTVERKARFNKLYERVLQERLSKSFDLNEEECISALLLLEHTRK